MRPFFVIKKLKRPKTEKKKIIYLGEKAFRFRLNQQATRLVALALVVLVSTYAIFSVRAGAIVIFAQTCTGGWVEPEKAAGDRQILAGGVSAQEAGEFSSLYLGGSTIVCSGFLPPDILKEDGVKIQHAYINFSIFRFSENQTLPEEESENFFSDASSTEQTEFFIDPQGEDLKGLENDLELIVGEETQAETSTEPASSLDGEASLPSSDFFEESSSIEPADLGQQVSVEEEISSSESASSTDAESGEGTDFSPEPTEDSSSTSPQSWFNFFAPKAFAQESEASSSSSESQASEVEIVEEAQAASETSSSSVSAEGEEVLEEIVSEEGASQSSSTLPADLENASSQQSEAENSEVEVILEKNTTTTLEEGDSFTVEWHREEYVREEEGEEYLDAQKYLEVFYSVGGEPWQSIGFITEDNWQAASFDVSLQSHEQVSNLRVGLLPVLSADDPPIIYLESVSLNIEHEKIEPPPLELPADELDDLAIEHSAEFVWGSAFFSDFKEAPEGDPLASHKCAVEPFYAALDKETRRAELALEIEPTDLVKSFRIKIGFAPQGVKALVVPSLGFPPKEFKILIMAEEDVQKGSFTIPVLYEEEREGVETSNFFCKFNLVIE